MLKQSLFKKASFNPFSRKLAEVSTPDVSPQAPDAIAKDAPQLDQKTALPQRLIKPLRSRKTALALALLGAGSGLAFTQVSPESIKEALPGSEPAAPLRQASDEPIELMAKGNRGLFLTNEIFYRKIEAIAQVPTSAPTTPVANKNTAEKAPLATKTAQTTNQTESKGQNAKKADTKPKTEEKVVAAAPPAPVVEAAPFAGTTIDNVLEMRVAVAKDVSAISLSTSGGGLITDLDGNLIKELAPESGVLAEINGGITLDGASVPSAFWVYPKEGGYVAVGDRWYRGRALVALRERGLIAVNYVLLGDYLYSVVGTEVSPDWPAESLKAQAVAARSYALTHNIHPASEAYFDLDNTQRFQAYKGIAREANTTQAAVQATSGEFISHDGGIVESLYAASQAIVDDAHKGSGMSQLGAKDLASQGYSYVEILAHYYPGTALGRIETDTE